MTRCPTGISAEWTGCGGVRRLGEGKGRQARRARDLEETPGTLKKHERSCFAVPFSPHLPHEGSGRNPACVSGSEHTPVPVSVFTSLSGGVTCTSLPLARPHLRSWWSRHHTWSRITGACSRAPMLRWRSPSLDCRGGGSGSPPSCQAGVEVSHRGRHSAIMDSRDGGSSSVSRSSHGPGWMEERGEKRRDYRDKIREDRRSLAGVLIPGLIHSGLGEYWS